MLSRAKRRKQCQWMFSFRGEGRGDLDICSYIANSVSRIRPPFRDLMDWNGAKVDHVIASRTRLEEIGIEATLRSQTSYPFVHEEWTEVSVAYLPNCSRFLAISWRNRSVEKTITLDRSQKSTNVVSPGLKLSAHGK